MKILIADDSGITRHLLRSCLRSWDYECIETNNGLDALEHLCDVDSPRLAILDWHMPGLDGPTVCQRLREAASDQSYCYLIMLTGNTDRDSLLHALEAGVDDFLTKPFDEAELKQRLQAGRRIITLQDRLVAAHETLKVQATHDQLTGCWNRGAILDILEQELDLAARTSRQVGVIMLDVDHFKQINDMHGHQVGDDVLCHIVDRLQIEMRSYDNLGRYGGEEFLVTVPEADVQDLTVIGERLRRSISHNPISTRGLELDVTISLGATTTCGQGNFDSEAMIRDADLALYSAKGLGRDCLNINLGSDLTILEVTPDRAFPAVTGLTDLTAIPIQTGI